MTIDTDELARYEYSLQPLVHLLLLPRLPLYVLQATEHFWETWNNYDASKLEHRLQYPLEQPRWTGSRFTQMYASASEEAKCTFEQWMGPTRCKFVSVYHPSIWPVTYIESVDLMTPNTMETSLLCDFIIQYRILRVR